LTGVADAADVIARHVRDVPDYPKPGIVFKDITPLLADPQAFPLAITTLLDGVADAGPFDKVAGIEARGFIFAAPMALRAGAGFVPVRKAGKLPGGTLAASYDLEYGSSVLEIKDDAVRPGDRVLLVDDVLATGGTLEATIGLLEQAGAAVAAVAVLIELTFLGGRDRLGSRPVHAVLVS
jgi:adenine phosphoribosyltransferase